MKINKEWHQANKMPKNPTQEERIKWHIEHAKNCSCYPISSKLAKEIEEYESGQIEGVKRMLSDNENCIKILTQLKAIRSAINAVMDQVIEEQFDKCLISINPEDKKLLIKMKKYVKNG
jgi:DNA-binding FrmR family transcriptional regulator